MFHRINNSRVLYFCFPPSEEKDLTLSLSISDIIQKNNIKSKFKMSDIAEFQTKYIFKAVSFLSLLFLYSKNKFKLNMDQ